jgi:hypothetical protein
MKAMRRAPLHFLTLLAVLGTLLPARWCCALGLQRLCCHSAPAPEEKPRAACCCEEPAPEEGDAPAPLQPGKPAPSPCCAERDPSIPPVPLDLPLDLVPLALLPADADADPAGSAREVAARSLLPGRPLHVLHSLWLC